MTHSHIETYPPINTLKPVCDDIWIVDGPIIRFGMPWPKFSFPTRMTIIRLSDGSLFLHSPTPVSPVLMREVEAIGTPKYIIGPNRIHYWWVPNWREAFPETEIFLAPRIREQAGDRIDFDTSELDRNDGYPWDDDILTLGLAGSYMTEVVFFHKKSRTLVITDIIENFEKSKVSSWWMRLATRLAGIQDPDGQMPRDMRLTFMKNKQALKQNVETMISWNPERIILAHGRWYRENGADELRRAFRWILKD